MIDYERKEVCCRIFSGIGYTNDKPLLCSEKALREYIHGFSVYLGDNHE